MPELTLPRADGSLERYALRNTPLPVATGSARPAFNRIAYAAAHVVIDPLAATDPWLESRIDWDATIAFRSHLWDLGLGVAEAMDTAQRGMGLDWPGAQLLIRHALAAARARPDALIACGVGTDHLAPSPTVTLDDVIRAYEEQFAFVEGLGGRVILMASRALVAAAKGPDDYVRVYDRLLRQAKEPVILHWLGEMFDPALAGYWGHADHDLAMNVAVDVINANAGKVDGIKISLLSADKEIAMRRRLAPSVRMYTGDDFNYAELIAGDDKGYSHALLGIFDAIAPAASAALAALARNDRAEFDAILAPTVPLSRLIFAAPTRFYKTGIVFLAWLNGFQQHFLMLGGQQSARSLLHFAEIFRLADAARMLADPERAARRMQHLLAVGGIEP
ncbi:MAG: dihydrodipicolinate synthase family protein [Devosia sp. 67-54]|uniref:dihydrodipicolinate synthase family protein n=1 Tax=unclassified Devosia TaxID=196773 RepID=UPI00095FE864|nr:MULTISPECIES: dihydrodipicolinate synthase family protein [unclassified Devosia]MBN9307392.1 dihydrodipicolinate synthase family protein [Devosia sp.]OJX19702.1 MAG: dihydrodipicolinate synthase family protein [Devosia sp. 67-54]